MRHSGAPVSRPSPPLHRTSKYTVTYLKRVPKNTPQTFAPAPLHDGAVMYARGFVGLGRDIIKAHARRSECRTPSTSSLTTPDGTPRGWGRADWIRCARGRDLEPRQSKTPRGFLAAVRRMGQRRGRGTEADALRKTTYSSERPTPSVS